MINIIKSKKSEINWYIIGIIVSIITFFVLAQFLSFTTNIVVSESEDQLCRGLIFTQDFSKAPYIGVFMHQITQKCKVDDFKINNKDKETTLDPIAELMKRCWYRYGEGEKDFLSSWDTENGNIDELGANGGWCFKCAGVEFKNENGDVYSYSDLLNYMKDKKIKTTEGDISYFEYTNMIVNDEGGLDSKVNQNLLNELIKQDSEFGELLLNAKDSQNQFLNSYNNKKIDPSEKTFVVYRFIRLERDLITWATETFVTTGEVGATALGVKLGLSPIKTSKSIIGGIKTTADIIPTGLDPNKLGDSARKIKDIIKGNPLSFAVIASVEGLISGTNTNYIAFVDVLNQEQYYRMCGTQRYES